WGGRGSVGQRRVLPSWPAPPLPGAPPAPRCRKAGEPAALPKLPFEQYLRCPDCHRDLSRDPSDALACDCGYRAPNEGGVYNLLSAGLRAELYPGDRDDVIDFSLPSHAAHLREGWYDLEGEFGNKYRWIGARATAVLRRVRPGPQRLRVRGYAHASQFAKGEPAVELRVNGTQVSQQVLERVGLFVIEADLPEAEEYHLEITATPTWMDPQDD